MGLGFYENEPQRRREASALGGFPDFPAGILLRVASPLLPKGEANAKGEATGVTQRKRGEEIQNSCFLGYTC